MYTGYWSLLMFVFFLSACSKPIVTEEPVNKNEQSSALINSPHESNRINTHQANTKQGITSNAHSEYGAAEVLYHSRPTVSPELSQRGDFQVGVITHTAVNPEQLNASNFITRKDRELVIEVWYPASADEDARLATYSDVTRSGKRFELQGDSYRNAPIKKITEKSSSAEKAYPLVILSHGYTGYRTIMYYLAEHLASHGYVVAAIDHTDSTNADVDFANDPFSGFASTLLNRARDQQFVLDYFSKLDSSLGNIIDTDTAAILGYSMGGYGAINTVGGCYAFTQESMQQFGIPKLFIPKLLDIFNTCNAGREYVDPRWKAMLAFAPWGGEQNVHSASSLNAISIPTLFVAGEFDDVSGYENGIKKLYEETGASALTAPEDTQHFMLVYENARHNIAAHPAPKATYSNDLDIGHYYEPAWNSETINRINQHMSLAFLDCHLKELAKACGYLPMRNNIVQTKQANGELSEPWPGFQQRWGAGVRFYRKGK